MSKLLVLRWFCKAKATRSVITYSSLSRKFKITDSELAPLKQKYKDFALTWFLEFKTKNTYSSWFTAYCFHDEIFGDTLYNTPTTPRRLFKYKDKNFSGKFLQVF